MSPDGRDAKRVVSKPEAWAAERDPAWSPDGKSIAFSARTRTDNSTCGSRRPAAAARVVSRRWPATSDGRPGRATAGLCSHSVRPAASGGSWPRAPTAPAPPVKLSPAGAAEWHGRVSPDGKLVAFVSDREPETGNDADIWVRELPAAGRGDAAAGATEISCASRAAAGSEAYPAWAPDNARVAYAATRGGSLGVWVSAIPSFDAPRSRRPPVAAAAAGLAAARRRKRAPDDAPRSPRATAACPPGRRTARCSRSRRSRRRRPATTATPTATTTIRRRRSRRPAQYALWRVLAPRAIDDSAASGHACPIPTARAGRRRSIRSGRR